MLPSGALVLVGVVLLIVAGTAVILAALTVGGRRTCARCSSVNPASAKFCGRCGAPLRRDAAPPSSRE